jgi:ABC-type sugar transport system ATPase subunit
MAISDRIAVMDRGRIVQCDTAETLYRHPVLDIAAIRLMLNRVASG